MWCKDESDSNKQATEGVCPKTAIRCIGKLMRDPRPATCVDYNYDYAKENPVYYEGFDFARDCGDEETDICVEESSTSRCNLHPQCEDGEDEMDCEEEYIRKGIFRPTETFECNFPSYTFANWTIKTHRAIRCDGKATCPNGEDEKDCKILKETIKYVIRK